MDLSHAIGWSLTGTANSPAPNLSFLYSMNNGGKGSSFAHRSQVGQKQSGKEHRPAKRTRVQDGNPPSASEDQLPSVVGQIKTDPSLPYDPVSTEDADLLLGLHSPYAPSSGVPATATSTLMPQNSNVSDYQPQLTPNYEQAMDIQQQFVDVHNQDWDSMLIRAQDIDMSGAQQFDLAFPGGDMIPWLEYLPQDVLTYFGDQHSSETMVDPSGSVEHG
jgi:hypothetical protein